MHIKDAVVNFFYNQGITIVTIQPEFKAKSNGDKVLNGMSVVQCLIGCQSLECAPKTCCSTNDLQMISSHDGSSSEETARVAHDRKLRKTTKATKDKTATKSRSLLSLNVTSLMKLRRFAGSTEDIMKKSASESHVPQMDDSDGGCGGGDSKSPSSTASTTPSTANHLQLVNSSIDELKETEFHKQCGERSEQRMPSNENLSQNHRIESTKHCEDSSLLNKYTDYNESPEID